MVNRQSTFNLNIQRDETGGENHQVPLNLIEQYVAKVMKIAGFVIETQDEMQIKQIVIQIADLSREFAHQKQLNFLSIQQICALIATFIKRGNGQYEVLNTNDESEEDSEGEEEEMEEESENEVQEKQNEHQSIPKNIIIQEEEKYQDVTNGGETNQLFSEQDEENRLKQEIDRPSSTTTEVNRINHYYNFDIKRPTMIKACIPRAYGKADPVVYEQNQIWIKGKQQFSGVFEWISFIRQESQIQIFKPAALSVQLRSLQNDKEINEIYIGIKPNAVFNRIIKLGELDFEPIARTKPVYEKFTNAYAILEQNEVHLDLPVLNKEIIPDEENFIETDEIYWFPSTEQSHHKVLTLKSEDGGLNLEENEVFISKNQPLNEPVPDLEYSLYENEAFLNRDPHYNVIDQEIEEQKEDIIVDDIKFEQKPISMLKTFYGSNKQQNTKILRLKPKGRFTKSKDNPFKFIYVQDTDQKSETQIQEQQIPQPYIEAPYTQHEQSKSNLIEIETESKQLSISQIPFADFQIVKSQNSRNQMINLRTSRSFEHIAVKKDFEFETPKRMKSRESSRNDNKIALFSEEEQKILAEEHLKNIFSDYAKQSSNAAGHYQTFENIGLSYERLIQRDLMRLFKQYGIEISKAKFQFLFKKYSTMGMYIDYSQFKEIMARILLKKQDDLQNPLTLNTLNDRLYNVFKCYPIDNLKAENQTQEEQSVTRLRKVLVNIQDKQRKQKRNKIKVLPTENLYQRQVQQKTLADEEYTFRLNIRNQLKEKRQKMRQNLLNYINNKMYSRNEQPQYDISMISEQPYLNLTIDHKKIEKKGGSNLPILNINSYQEFEDEEIKHQPSPTDKKTHRYHSTTSRQHTPYEKRKTSGVRLPSIKRLPNDLSQNSIEHQSSKLLKLRYQEKAIKLKEMGESYSENEIGQFHMDSLPAILSEFVQVLEVQIVNINQLNINQSQDENQDIAVLDQINQYIRKTLQSQFINDNTIMFSIDDVMALVDRFIREFTQDYQVKDLRKPKPVRTIKLPKWIPIFKYQDQENSHQELMLGDRGFPFIDQITKELSINTEFSLPEEKSLSITKAKPVYQLIFKEDSEVIAHQNIKPDFLEINLPSPKFANIQYIFEWQEENNLVIPLDESLLPKPESQQPIQEPKGFSFREVIMKTIKEYESILDSKGYKDEEDRLRIEKLILDLRQQLENHISSDRKDQKDYHRAETPHQEEEVKSFDLNSPPRVNEEQLHLGQKIENLLDNSQFMGFNDSDLNIDNKKLSNLTPEEMKLQNIQEIFLLYCRQHVMVGKNATFEEIQKQKVMEVFKKTALYSREMYFSHFKMALILVQKECNQQRINQIKKEYKEVKNALAQVHDNDQAQQRVKERLQNLTLEHQKLRLANEDEEGLYKYITEIVIEVGDPNKYRKKMKGFIQSFGVGDKQQRLNELSRDYHSLNTATSSTNHQPFLYHNSYRNKVQSIVKTEIQEHQKLREVLANKEESQEKDSPRYNYSQSNRSVMTKTKIGKRVNTQLQSISHQNILDQSKMEKETHTVANQADTSFVGQQSLLESSSVESLSKSPPSHSPYRRRFLPQVQNQNHMKIIEKPVSLGPLKHKTPSSDRNAMIHQTSQDDQSYHNPYKNINNPNIIRQYRGVNYLRPQKSNKSTFNLSDIEEIKSDLRKGLNIQTIANFEAKRFEKEEFYKNLIDEELNDYLMIDQNYPEMKIKVQDNQIPKAQARKYQTPSKFKPYLKYELSHNKNQSIVQNRSGNTLQQNESFVLPQLTSKQVQNIVQTLKKQPIKANLLAKSQNQNLSTIIPYSQVNRALINNNQSRTNNIQVGVQNL